MEINIRHDDKAIRNEFGQFMTRFKEAREDLTREFMEITLQELRKSAESNLDQFEGNLMDSLKMENVEKTRDGEKEVGLALPIDVTSETGVNYAMWHEFADEGHWVKVKNTDRDQLKKWSQKNLGKVPYTLFVTPQGPFIRPAVRRAGSRINQKLEDPGNALGELAD